MGVQLEQMHWIPHTHSFAQKHTYAAANITVNQAIFLNFNSQSWADGCAKKMRHTKWKTKQISIEILKATTDKINDPFRIVGI